MPYSSIVLRTCVSVAALALAAAIVMPADPASASGRRAGGIATGIGIGIGAGIILNELSKVPGVKAAPQKPSAPSRSRSRSSSDDDDEEDEKPTAKKSKPKSDEERAADARNHAAQQAELQEIQRSERLEQERNVNKAIRDFVVLLERWHKWLRENSNANVKVSSGSNINQVTDGEIKRVVEKAYESARLGQFERMAGEVWTRDRLTVRILDHSRKELAEYFKGVGVKGASMDDLRDVFEKSARHVYAHALQVSEMIGVSHSFDRFIRTIYEHSDQAEESLSTIGADARYERVVGELVDRIPRQTFISDQQALANDPLGLEKQFLFRFRARRVLYDCMASRYAELIGGGGTGKSIQISAPARGASIASEARSDIWVRMSDFVGSNCRESVGAVATEAKDGRMLPKPARWDSATGGQPALGTGGGSILFPAQGAPR